MDNLEEHWINDPKYTYEELKRWRDEWLQRYEGQLEKTPEQFPNITPQISLNQAPFMSGFPSQWPQVLPNVPNTTSTTTKPTQAPDTALPGLTFAPTPFSPTAPGQTNLIRAVEPISPLAIRDLVSTQLESPVITNTEIADLVNAQIFNQRAAVINNQIAVQTITEAAIATYNAYDYFSEITRLNIEGRAEEAKELWERRREILDRNGINRDFESASDGLQYSISTYNNLRVEAIATTLPNYYDDQGTSLTGLMPYEEMSPISPNTSVFSWFKSSPTFSQPNGVPKEASSDVLGNLANLKDRTSTSINYFEGTPFCKIVNIFNPFPPTPTPDSVSLPTASPELLMQERNKAITLNDQDTIKQIALSLPAPSTFVPPDVTGPNPAQLEDQGTLGNKEAAQVSLVPIGGPAPENEIDKQVIINDFLKQITGDLQEYMQQPVDGGEGKYGYLLIDKLAEFGILAARIAQQLIDSTISGVNTLIEIAYLGAEASISAYLKLLDFSNGLARPKRPNKIDNNFGIIYKIGHLGAVGALETYNIIKDLIQDLSEDVSIFMDRGQIFEDKLIERLKEIATLGLIGTKATIEKTIELLSNSRDYSKLTTEQIMEIGRDGTEASLEVLKTSSIESVAKKLGFTGSETSLSSLETFCKGAQNISVNLLTIMGGTGLLGAQAALYAIQKAGEIGLIGLNTSFQTAALLGANSAQALTYLLNKTNETKSLTNEIISKLINYDMLGYVAPENQIKRIPYKLTYPKVFKSYKYKGVDQVINDIKNFINISQVNVEKFGEITTKVAEGGLYGAEVFYNVVKYLAENGYEATNKSLNLVYDGAISTKKIVKSVLGELNFLNHLSNYNPLTSNTFTNLSSFIYPELKQITEYLFTVTDLKTELNNIFELMPSMPNISSLIPDLKNLLKYFEAPKQASPYLLTYDGMDEELLRELENKKIKELELIEAMDEFLNSEIEKPVNFDFTVINPSNLEEGYDYNLEDPGYLKKMEQLAKQKEIMYNRPLTEIEKQNLYAELSKTIEPPIRKITNQPSESNINVENLSYAQLSSIAKNYANIIYGNILKRGKVLSTDIIDMAVAIETFNGIKNEIFNKPSFDSRLKKSVLTDIVNKLTNSISSYKGDVPRRFEIANRIYLAKTLDEIKSASGPSEIKVSLPDQVKNIRKTYDIWKRIAEIKKSVPSPQDVNVPTTTPIETVNLATLASATKTTQEATPLTITPAVGKAIKPVQTETTTTGEQYLTMGQKVTKMYEDIYTKAVEFAGPSGGWPYNSNFQASTTSIPPSYKVVVPKITSQTTPLPTPATTTVPATTQLLAPEIIKELEDWGKIKNKGAESILKVSETNNEPELYEWADAYIQELENVNDAVKQSVINDGPTSPGHWIKDLAIFKWAEHVLTVPTQVASKAQRLGYEPSVYDALEMAFSYSTSKQWEGSNINLKNNLLLLKSLSEYLTSGNLSPQTEQYLIANYDTLKEMLAQATKATEDALITGKPAPQWISKYDKLLKSLTGYAALKESTKGAYNAFVLYSALKVASDTVASLYHYSGLWMFMPFSHNIIESYYNKDMTLIDKMVLLVDSFARGVVDVTVNNIPAIVADFVYQTDNVPKKIESATDNKITKKGSGKIFNKKTGQEELNVKNGINAIVKSAGKEKTWEEYAGKYSGKTYKAGLKTPNNSLINMHIRIPNETELGKWAEYSQVFSLIGALIDQQLNPNVLKNLKTELDQISLSLTTGANINTSYKVNSKLDYVGRILGALSYVIKKLQYVDNGQSEATIHMIETIYEDFISKLQEFLAEHYNTEYSGTLKSIVGAGLGDISKGYQNVKMLKESTAKVSEIPKWKRLHPMTVANDYIITNKNKNVGLGLRKDMININEEPIKGCRLCDSWNNLLVHNKNDEDVTCTKCFEGRGKMTSQRYTARTANIIPINKSEKHKGMLKQWQNNNMIKLLKQTSPNGEVAQSRFEKFNSNNNKDKILRWANKAFIPTDSMSNKHLSKYLTTLISANEYSPELLRRRGRVNLNNMLNKYLLTQKANSNIKDSSINFSNADNFEKQLQNPSNSVLKALGLYQI